MPAPTITSSPTINTVVGQALNFQFTADNNPTSFNGSGLPSGLSLSSSGLLTGPITDKGTYSFQVYASNAFGPGFPQNITLTVGGATPIPESSIQKNLVDNDVLVPRIQSLSLGTYSTRHGNHSIRIYFSSGFVGTVSSIPFTSADNSLYLEVPSKPYILDSITIICTSGSYRIIEM